MHRECDIPFSASYRERECRRLQAGTIGPIRAHRRAAAGAFALGMFIGLPVATRAQDLSTYLPQGTPGAAQEPGVTVLSRLRPLYDAPGVRAGSFVIRPELDQGFGFNSNVTGFSPGGGSWLLRTNPSVTVNSDWSRDQLGFSAMLDDHRYLNTPQQSYTDWTVGATGGLTVGRRNIVLGYSHLSLHQTPSDIGAIQSDTPIPYTVEDLNGGYTFDQGRLSLIPQVDFKLFRFTTASILGTTVSQQYRDRNVLTAGVTVRYALSGATSLLLLAEGINSSYITASLPAQPDSRSVLVLGGIDYAASGIWRYRLLVGAEDRKFSAAQFPSRTGLVAQGSAIWSPSGLTTVTGLLSRTIEDPSTEGSAGYTYTTAQLVLDHEYRRDILLQGRLGGQVAEYLQSGATQTSLTVGAGITKLLNRNMRLTLDYNFTTQSAPNYTVNGAANLAATRSGDFTRSLLQLTLRFAL